MLMSTNELTKFHNEKCILDKVSFSIEDTDKIALVGVNGTGKSTFLKILADKDRLALLADIEKDFKVLLNEKNNILEGIVITAVPMKEEEVKELQTKLSAKYNKTVVLENEVDKSVLGGVLVRLGNEEIDGTVKNRLDKMKEQLSQVIS
jgi:F-type H+-transporting ATPase subunit delta